MLKYTSLILLTLLACGQKKGAPNVPELDAVQWDRAHVNLECIATLLNHSTMGDFLMNSTSTGVTEENAILRSRVRFPYLKDSRAVQLINRLADSSLIHFNHYYLGIYYSDLPEFKRISPLPDLFYQHPRMDSLSIESLIQQLENEIRKEFNRDTLWAVELINSEECMGPAKGITGIDSALNALVHFLKIDAATAHQFIQVQGIPYSFNFGPSQGSTYYFITGNFDCPQKPGFQHALSTAIHEFSHSYVSFLDEDPNRQMIAELDSWNTPELQRAMRVMGQGDDWPTVFEEHLVRALEIKILRIQGKLEAANERIAQEKQDGMLYVEHFLQGLDNYEQESAQSFSAYFPNYLNDLKQSRKSESEMPKR